MFKRPKGVSDSTASPPAGSPGARQDASKSDSQKDTPADQSADESGAAGTRVVTPSYQARKPTVRTLHSPTGQAPAPNTSTPAANLHVGRGLKLEGKIQSCDSLVIEGDVQATIESGTLTITETGDVRGEATVDEAEVNGKFDGTLVVRKCLTINNSGRVTGSVRYGELKVEQGGQISGEIQAEDKGNSGRQTAKASDSTEKKIEASTERSASMV